MKIDSLNILFNDNKNLVNYFSGAL